MRKWTSTLALALALAMAPQAAHAYGPIADGADACDEVPQAQGAAQEAAQPTITREGGVYEWGGVTETWYSSEAAYHWRTPEWWEDDEGFWRTEGGCYVVASDGWPEGSVIETSKGAAQVLDCGCGEDVVDFYTAW